MAVWIWTQVLGEKKPGHSISAKFSLVETSFAGMGLTFYLKPVMYNGCNIFLIVCASY